MEACGGGEFCDLRTRVINLATAERYEVEDVLRSDDTFAEAYYEKNLREVGFFQRCTRIYRPDGGTDDGRGDSGGKILQQLCPLQNDIYVNLTYHYYDEGLIMHWLGFHAVDDGGTGSVPDGQRSVGEIFEVILRKWKQNCFHFAIFLCPAGSQKRILKFYSKEIL